jgi:hypothetical protein
VRYDRRIGKQALFIVTHKDLALGFHISRHGIDIDLLFIYIGLEF